MRLLRNVLLLMLCCAPAKAEDQKIDVGRGVVCDTADQVMRFVALRADGKEPDAALKAINHETGDAACSFGFVMFTGGEPMAELSANGRPVSVVRIVVHAFGNGAGWRRVPETVQYTPMSEQGRVA
jgi:hypothetical protein